MPPAAAAPNLSEPLAQRAFLANLRHELRTPINAIIGYSEMMLEDAALEDAALEDAALESAALEDAAQKKSGGGLRGDLERILSAGRELLRLVDSTLNPSAIEERQLALDTDAFSAHLRHELRTPVNAIIGYAELLIEEVPAQGQENLLPDLEKIREAANRFLGLIHEVVHFTRIQAGDAPSMQTAATQDLLQEALSTVRTLEEKPPSAPASKAEGKILVVDDNPINRDILSRYVERLEHRVETAPGGEAALKLMAARKFDLVLLDVMMPGMNGYQVLEHIKRDPSLRDIPVIMISALDEVDSVVRCIESGAEDYLPKPFNPVLLKARVDACLEKKRLRDKEVEYLQQVAIVTDAAAAVEAAQFSLNSLDPVSVRPDALGQLARVFQRMAREVYIREQRLKQQVMELRIQVDEAKKAREVAQITETEYFQQLQTKARRLRDRKGA
jgi:CheY-like chemotaxis protein